MSEDIWYRHASSVNNDFDYYNGETEIPFYSSDRFTYRMLLVKKDYYKCNFSIKHVDVLDKFVGEHYGLTPMLKHCDTLEEQYKIVKFIKSLCNKEGDWVIGLLENVHLRNNDFKLTNEFILNLVEENKKTGFNELNVKADLSRFKYKKYVKEINTINDLRNEGKKMGQCVGGYYETIESDESRIFHIEYDGIGSTLQILCPHTQNIFDIEPHSVNKNKCTLVYNDGTKKNVYIKTLIYSNSQHYGRYPEKGNLTPNEKNVEIVEELIKYFNNNYLDEKIRNFIIAVKEKSSIFV